MKAEQVKEVLKDLGADLCNIASTDRFDEAPEGFHPLDVYPDCKSVIVFAKKFISGVLDCDSIIPYTIVRNSLSSRLDHMAVKACEELEQLGAVAVPTGTIGPTVYDKRTGRSRNIVSAKHCAQAAGMGVIGKNTLLITQEYGNMVWLSVILTDLELEADPLLEKKYCPDSCNLCKNACPAQALGEAQMKQTACHAHAFRVEEGDNFYIRCHACRSICPYCRKG